MKRQSKNWLERHRRDPHVRRSKSDGYRSRAVYKLEEIDQRDRLVRPGMRVLELGAAPGGWCQYLAPIVGAKGRVVAVDLLPMDAVDGVEIILGDLLDEVVQSQIEAALGAEKVDLLLSDMAPNLTGIRDVDQARMAELLELTLALSERFLRRGGDLLTKSFHGRDCDLFKGNLRQHFDTIAVRKPSASRDRSSEHYILARSKGS